MQSRTCQIYWIRYHLILIGDRWLRLGLVNHKPNLGSLTQQADAPVFIHYIHRTEIQRYRLILAVHLVRIGRVNPRKYRKSRLLSTAIQIVLSRTSNKGPAIRNVGALQFSESSSCYPSSYLHMHLPTRTDARYHGPQ